MTDFLRHGVCTVPGLIASAGAPIDAAGRIQIDEWRGTRRVKLHLADVAVRTHE